MKKLKKFFDKIKKLFKKQVANYNKNLADKKLNKLYQAKLDRGLLEMGITNRWLANYYFKLNIWKKYSPDEALEKALQKAAADNHAGNYNLALKIAMATTLPRPHKHKELWWAIGTIVAFVAVVLIILIIFHPTVPKNEPKPISPEITACTTWVMEPMAADDINNRWFADGIVEINDAKTPEQAKEAARIWLGKTKLHRELLIAASRAFLTEDKWKNLDLATISSDGSCANDATVQLYLYIESTIVQSSVDAGYAPENGYNTGVENGIVVADANPGISGDRRAVQVTLRDGRKVWIMGRCGNIVTTKDVYKHHGKTDEHHRHHPVCTKNCTPLTPKSSNINDYQRPGTDNTKDSGTGTKPKASVNTPAESTPPIVSTVKVGGGGVVDTPTNHPGSESGVTAPAAKPAPITPPAPKPNEGGSNNGVVTD